MEQIKTISFFRQWFLIAGIILSIAFSSDSVFAQVKGTLEVEIKVKKNNAPLPNSEAKVMKNGVVVNTFKCPTGKCNFKIELSGTYQIYVTSPGHITKYVEINASVPEEKDAEEFFYLFAIDLWEKVEGIDNTGLDKPVAKFAYNAASDDFDFDKGYSNVVKRENAVAKEQTKAVMKVDTMQAYLAKKAAEDEARRKAEAEAKAKAELEAKLKAEAEAIAKAEAEAKRKAEEEARLKKEAEQKALAEAEAKRKAEEEAKKAAATEEARKKAEAEAKIKAEEEARRKAEQERLAAEAMSKAKSEEERQKLQEAEKLRLQEEARKKAEEDAAKSKAFEEEKKRLQAEAQAKAEADAAKRMQSDEERKKQAEADRLKAEAEAKAKADQNRLRMETDAQARAAAEAKRIADEEAKKKAIQDAEAKRLADEEARKKSADEIARMKAEAAEREKLKGEEYRKNEADKIQQELSAKRIISNQLTNEVSARRDEENKLTAEVTSQGLLVNNTVKEIGILAGIQKMEKEAELIPLQIDYLKKQLAVKSKEIEKLNKEKELAKVQIEIAILEFREKDVLVRVDTVRVTRVPAAEMMRVEIAVGKALQEQQNLNSSIAAKEKELILKQEAIRVKKEELAKAEEAAKIKAEEAEKLRLALEEKARLEAEAKAKAEEEKQKKAAEEAARLEAEKTQVEQQLASKEPLLSPLENQIAGWKQEETKAEEEINSRNLEISEAIRQPAGDDAVSKLEKEISILTRKLDLATWEATLRDKQSGRMEKELERNTLQQEIALLKFRATDIKAPVDTSRINRDYLMERSRVDFALGRSRQEKKDLDSSIVLKNKELESKKSELEKAKAKAEEDRIKKEADEKARAEAAEKERIEKEQLTAELSGKQSSADQLLVPINTLKEEEKVLQTDIAARSGLTQSASREAALLKELPKMEKQTESLTLQVENLHQEIKLREKLLERFGKERERSVLLQDISVIQFRLNNMKAPVDSGLIAPDQKREQARIDFNALRTRQEIENMTVALANKEKELEAKKEETIQKREAVAKAEEEARIKKEEEEKRKKEAEELARAEAERLKGEVAGKQAEAGTLTGSILTLKTDEEHLTGEINQQKSQINLLAQQSISLSGLDKIRKQIEIVNLEVEVLNKQLELKNKQSERLQKEKEMNNVQQELTVMDVKIRDFNAKVDSNKLLYGLKTEEIKIDFSISKTEQEKASLTQGVKTKEQEVATKKEFEQKKKEEIEKAEAEAKIRAEEMERLRQEAAEKKRQAEELIRQKKEEEEKLRLEMEAKAASDREIYKGELAAKQAAETQVIGEISSIRSEEDKVNTEIALLNNEAINNVRETNLLIGIEKLKKQIDIARVEKSSLEKQVELKDIQMRRLGKEKELNRVLQDEEILKFRINDPLIPVDSVRILRVLRNEDSKIDFTISRNRQEINNMRESVINKEKEIITYEQLLRQREEEAVRMEAEQKAKRDAEERSRLDVIQAHQNRVYADSVRKAEEERLRLEGALKANVIPDGIKEETITEPNREIKQTTVMMKGVKTVFQIVATNYGAVWYYKNGRQMTQASYEIEMNSIRQQLQPK